MKLHVRAPGGLRLEETEKRVAEVERAVREIVPNRELSTISSNIGEMTYVIRDGVNGFLADNEEEWVEKLKRLVESRELRAKIGKAGQETMRKDECYEAIMPEMVKIIRDVQKTM